MRKSPTQWRCLNGQKNQREQYTSLTSGGGGCLGWGWGGGYTFMYIKMLKWNRRQVIKDMCSTFLIRQWGNNWWDIPLWATAVWDWYTGIVLRWWWWWLWWWLWWRRLALGGGIQSQDVKLGARLRRGTVYGRGQPGSVRWAGGRSGAGGGWANVKVGNAGGACRSSTWATEEGGQK